MNWYIPIAAAAGLFVGVCIASAFFAVRSRSDDARGRAVQEDMTDEFAAVKPQGNPILIQPPMIDGETLMQWAIHYHIKKATPGASDDPEFGIWSVWIREMYMRSSSDDGVMRHFNFTDLERLQKKFTATLCMVLNSGVRAAAVPAMKKAHAPYDITDREYEVVVQHLLDILGEGHVPQNAINTVIEIAQALAPVIIKRREVSNVQH